MEHSPYKYFLDYISSLKVSRTSAHSANRHAICPMRSAARRRKRASAQRLFASCRPSRSCCAWCSSSLRRGLSASLLSFTECFATACSAAVQWMASRRGRFWSTQTSTSKRLNATSRKLEETPYLLGRYEIYVMKYEGLFGRLAPGNQGGAHFGPHVNHMYLLSMQASSDAV